MCAILFAVGAMGCAKFDAPPQVTLVGVEDGILPDPTAPLVLEFHEPIVEDSLSLRVIRLQVDGEGEIHPHSEVLFDNDPDAEQLGLAELSADRMSYTITTIATLPIGPQLALEIRSGLADEAGNTWVVNQVIKFGFEFSCGEEGMVTPTTFPDAVHFMLVDVEEPLSTQLQLFANIVVNRDEGTFVGQFTNGDRDASLDCSPHGLTCAAEQVCRLLPEPACAKPSDNPTSANEYPDFTFNNTPPEGYSFTITGCVRDQPGNTWAFANAPADVEVQTPPVTVKGINFNASFGYDADGILRGDGTFTAQDIFLGNTPSGAGSGTVTMRDIPEDEIKDGLPAPP